MIPKSRSSLRGSSRLLIAACFLALAACSGDDEEEIPETPAEELYYIAFVTMQDDKLETAAKMFEEVERQHPYSRWATQAQLMAAYSYYLSDAYDDAIIALERFIELHPGNRSAPYAYYLLSLCYYDQITDVGRDQRNTELALQSLAQVVARFPNTDYARDASLKIDLTQDHLAGKEMEIGRYYQMQGHHLAAINRYRRVIDRFQTTTHVPEALHRLVESYLALGVVEEAQQTASVLGHNFPGSDWYQDSYALLVERDLEPIEPIDESGGLF
ncbi:MAG: outer membrane protein assembly factor BamD [Dongiaceae bacterium]